MIDNNIKISTKLFCGIGNRLFYIVHVILISKLYNLTYFFSDKYSVDLAWKSNYHFKNNIFNKLNFDYYFFGDDTHYGLNYKPIELNNNDLLLNSGDIEKIYNYDFSFENNYNYIIDFDNDKNLYINYKYFDSNFFSSLFIDETIIKELKIKYNFKNSICIQVRRGDYLLSLPQLVKDADFFYNGIKEIEKYKNIDNIYVMSDDMNWCENNIIDQRITYIHEQDYIQLYLSTLCENFIICNSTFSLWSIELNTIQNKIVITDNNCFFNNSCFNFFINNTKHIKI